MPFRVDTLLDATTAPVFPLTVTKSTPPKPATTTRFPPSAFVAFCSVSTMSARRSSSVPVGQLLDQHLHVIGDVRPEEPATPRASQQIDRGPLLRGYRAADSPLIAATSGSVCWISMSVTRRPAIQVP